MCEHPKKKDYRAAAVAALRRTGSTAIVIDLKLPEVRGHVRFGDEGKKKGGGEGYFGLFQKIGKKLPKNPNFCRKGPN